LCPHNHAMPLQSQALNFAVLAVCFLSGDSDYNIYTAACQAVLINLPNLRIIKRFTA
jgi:hypothetical protein